jgi:hypothetical protein
MKNFNFDFCHVLLRYNGILGFGTQVCLLAIWSFTMAEDKNCAIENINRIDEVFTDMNTIPFQSNNFSNVESVHQQ